MLLQGCASTPESSLFRSVARGTGRANWSIAPFFIGVADLLDGLDSFPPLERSAST